MLDQFFYELNKGIYAIGPDWAVISIFLIIILIALYAVIALQVNRLFHAGMGVIILIVVTYIPLVCFPKILESLYLTLGLITPWYLQSVPNVIIFPTLWLPAIFGSVLIWTVCAVAVDLIKGKPLLTKRINARIEQYADDLSRQKIEQWRQEKIKFE